MKVYVVLNRCDCGFCEGAEAIGAFSSVEKAEKYCKHEFREIDEIHEVELDEPIKFHYHVGIDKLGVVFVIEKNFCHDEGVHINHYTNNLDAYISATSEDEAIKKAKELVKEMTETVTKIEWKKIEN